MTNKEIDEIFDLLAEAQDLLEKYKYLDGYVEEESCI